MINNYKKLFFGIVESGKYEDWKVEVFLINPTDEEFRVSQGQGSAQSDDSGLLDLGWGTVRGFVLEPKNYQLVDMMTDGGELDFLTTYSFQIQIENGEEVTLMNSVNGWDVSSSPDKVVTLPILEKKGIYKAMWN